jgi:ABC-2 type transport system ATP-binding protein
VIEVEHLTKHYGERTAVRDVSFRVERGEVIGFLGPNGAGKSTTLKMLTGYLVPHEGRIRIGGVDAVAEPLEARRLIGYMPETVPVYRELRVDEFLRYRARLKGVARRAIKARVDAALELARVGDVRGRIIGQLSRGYRARVGLADALVADPPLLVLDEPTAGLDPNQIRQVRDLVRSMAGEKTVLLSTHILPEVESTCGRVLIIHDGRLVGEGAPGELRSAAAGGEVLAIEARAPRARLEEIMGRVEGVRRVLDVVVLDPEQAAPPRVRMRLEATGSGVAEGIFHAVAEAGLRLRELRRESASLEDVFARLTTEDSAATGSTGLGGAAEAARAGGDAASESDAPKGGEA